MSDPSIAGFHEDFWKRCSSCKKELPYSQNYWVCNVSTCNRKRVGYQFCSVTCWDAHLPTMNHRESWAEERKAPSKEHWLKELKGELEPKKRAPKKEETAPVVEAPKTSTAPTVLVRRKG